MASNVLAAPKPGDDVAGVLDLSGLRTGGAPMVRAAPAAKPEDPPQAPGDETPAQTEPWQAALVEATGDILVNRDGKWVHAHIAYEPSSRSKLYWDGVKWADVPLTAREKEQGWAVKAAQGAAFGFGDEALAAIGHPASAIRAAYGVEPESGAYYRELNDARDVAARYEREAPGYAFATEAAGSVPTVFATGAGQIMRAPKLTTALWEAAKTGAKYGAVAGYGAGEGGIEGRVESAAGGAAAGAIIGAGFRLLAPAVQPLYRMIKALGQRAGATVNPLWDAKTQTLTAQGQKIAREAGLDPMQTAKELQEAFAREAADAADPRHALAVAEAQTLPKPVPLTRGQVSGDAAQQLRENRALQGSRGGPIAQRIMETAQANTQQALRDNLTAIQGKIAGPAGQVVERGQGAAGAQAELVARARSFKKSVDKAYDVAEAAGDAVVQGNAFTTGAREVADSVHRTYHPDNIPAVEGILRRLVTGDPVKGTQPSQLVSDLFQARRELVGMQANGGAEGSAAGAAKRALDEWLKRLTKADLAGADRSIIDKWFAAIKLRAEYGRRFEQDLIGDLVETKQFSDELVIDPVDAANRILGVGDKAQLSRPGLVRNLTKIRDELGADSAEWRGLRQEMFMRLAHFGDGATTGTGEQFSAAKLIKAWREFKRLNPHLVGLMFDQQERATMEQFVRVAERTITKEGGRQMGSGAALTQLYGEWLGKMFPALARGLTIAGDLPIVRETLDAPAAAAASSYVRRPVVGGRMTSGAGNAALPALTDRLASPTTMSPGTPVSQQGGPQTADAQPKPKPPEPGQIVTDTDTGRRYRFKGGALNDQRNYEPVD